MTDIFSFHDITEDEVRKEISKLDGSKAIPVADIPAEMLKSTIDVHVSLLTKIINSSLRNGCFPDELKAAEVTPIFKKNDDLDKENYRPVSVLPHVSKIIERSCGYKLKISQNYQNCLQVSGKTIAPKFV